MTMSTTRDALIRPLLLLALLLAAPVAASAQESPATVPADTSATLSAEERALYIGTYEVETPDGPMAIRIYEDGDRLMGLPEDEDEPSALVPLGDHRFEPVLAEGAVMTFVVENDRAVNFTITFPDERGTMSATRRP